MQAANFANINGLRMYYEVHGAGQPLVLIHGGGSTIETTFGQVLPHLARHFKIVAVELQAHGRTSDRPAPETFEQDADDVATLLQLLNIRPASIFGFSNGGNTAMQIAIRHPQMVSNLVIASAFYRRDGMQPGFFEGLASATIDVMPKELKDGFLKVNPDEAALQNMFDKDRNRMLAFTDWSDDTLRSIVAPALILLGDKDVMQVTHAIQMANLIPNAQLVVLPGGHGTFISEITSANKESKWPEITVAIITEWLNEKAIISDSSTS